MSPKKISLSRSAPNHVRRGRFLRGSELGEGFAVLGDDDLLAGLRHLVLELQARGLELRCLDGARTRGSLCPVTSFHVLPRQGSCFYMTMVMTMVTLYFHQRRAGGAFLIPMGDVGRVAGWYSEGKAKHGIVRTAGRFHVAEGADMEESKITSKGQTTIPKKVREEMSIKPGDRLRYVVDGNVLLVFPVRPISELRRSMPYDGPTVTLEEMEQAFEDGALGRPLRPRP